MSNKGQMFFELIIIIIIIILNTSHNGEIGIRAALKMLWPVRTV
jgi:hypothetical protein